MDQSIEPYFPWDLLTGEREREGGGRERKRERRWTVGRRGRL